MLTFKYYTNLRLQLLVFGMWSIRSSCWNTGGGGGGFHRPWADLSQTLASLSNADGGKSGS